ncbi:glycosyltransferase [Marinobacter sp. VGCF2001]|uniref:glycosyltransferase n=1 Tax=Marinobacter sp. VGCF2001 TaxID=3417189 RepID=UPI003CF933A6
MAMRTESVWFFISDLGQGGAQKVCSTLVCELHNQGQSVGLVVLRGDQGSWPLPESVVFHSFGCNHARSVLPRLISWIRSVKPEVILVFNHQLAVLLIIARAVSGVNVKIVARNISNLTEKYSREAAVWHRYVVNPLVKLLFQRADTVVAQSRGMARDLVENYGFTEEKIALIPNPVEFRNIEGVTRTGTYGCHKFLFVGRLEPVKNLPFLLKAFSELRKRLENVGLTILGEGSERPRLEAMCKELRISDYVRFLGWQNPDSYYASSDVTVLTSHYEGFPNVLIESMVHGKPVVSVDCPSGPNEVIVRGVNGFLVSQVQSERFAACMEEAALRVWEPAEIRGSVSRFAADAVAQKYWQLLSGIGQSTGC